MEASELLTALQRQGFTLTPLWDGRLEVKPASRLTAEQRENLRRLKPEMLSLLEQQKMFLDRHLPSSALQTFPDWQGLLIKSSVLGLAVWVVRTREEGEELAHETGHPALLLDDVLKQRGKTTEEVRATLLPVLIMSQQ
jgi:hypothetical protein